MVFDGDSSNMDICSLADLPNKTNDTTFPKARKAMYANMGLREIFREIYASYGGWNIIDTNKNGLDHVATTLLNDGTQFYAFATAQAINGVEYLDDAGNHHVLDPITLEEIREMGYAEDEFNDTPSTPRYYRPVKNGIKIYPAWYTTKAAVTDGLIVKIAAQDVSPFTAASTNTEPGYDSLAGHEALADFMSMKYSDENDKSNFAKRQEAWLRGLAGIVRHYRNKFKEIRPTVKKTARGRSVVDDYM